MRHSNTKRNLKRNPYSPPNTLYELRDLLEYRDLGKYDLLEIIAYSLEYDVPVSVAMKAQVDLLSGSIEDTDSYDLLNLAFDSNKFKDAMVLPIAEVEVEELGALPFVPEDSKDGVLSFSINPHPRRSKPTTITYWGPSSSDPEVLESYDSVDSVLFPSALIGDKNKLLGKAVRFLKKRLTTTPVGHYYFVEPGYLPGKDDSGDADWRREQAMQAGMAGGTRGYNSAMGWDNDD